MAANCIPGLCTVFLDRALYSWIVYCIPGSCFLRPAVFSFQVNISKNTIRPHIGEPAQFHGVPFSLTEEFVSVYRMHSLLPDKITIRDIGTRKKTKRTYDLPDISFGHARQMFEENELEDVLYTFGVENPGNLVLRNFPEHLTELELPRHQGGRVGCK